MARSLQRSRCSAALFGPQVLPPWIIAERTQASHNLPLILDERCLVVRTGKSFLTFSGPRNIWQQWHCHSLHQSALYRLGSKSGFHIKHGAVNMHFAHYSATDGPSLAITPAADIVWSDTSRLMMTLYILSTHIMHCGHWMELFPTPLLQTAEGHLTYFLRTSWPTSESRNLFYFYTTPFTFHANLPRLKLGRLSKLIQKAVDEKQCVILLLLDLNSAFDTIDH